MLRSIVNLVKTEPAMITAAVQAILALAVSTGLNLTSAQTGGLLAVTTAVLALIAGASARPFQVPALTGLVGAVVTLLVAFGVHGVNPGLVSTLNGAMVAVMAIVLRGHVTPVASLRKPSPVPSPSPVPPRAA